MMLIGCVICKLNALITFWGSKMMNNLNHNFSQETSNFSSISPGLHRYLRKHSITPVKFAFTSNGKISCH